MFYFISSVRKCVNLNKSYLDAVFSGIASLLIDELNDSDNIFVGFDCKGGILI